MYSLSFNPADELEAAIFITVLLPITLMRLEMNPPSETDSNPHKKIKTSPQIRSLFEGKQTCRCISKIKPNQLSKSAQYRKMVQ